MIEKQRLLKVYEKLYRAFGPQGWWPADTAFEVILGAILTQSTSWQNVERAITNLKNANSLSFKKLSKMKMHRLAQLIKPAGYYNVKAKRLKNFILFLKKNYSGDLNRMKKKDTLVLRRQLLSICGIGPETADSILLYALQKPVFVVDAYTRRIFSRHGFVEKDVDYETLQRLFTRALPSQNRLFNEYHALLVRLGKEFCKKTKMKCPACPLGGAMGRLSL
jgi:endonuclease-3 related protein